MEMPGVDHRALAVELFNHTWSLLDLPERTPGQDVEMVHAAHASRWHWAMAEEGTPLNVARGEWLVARVHAVLGHGAASFRHASVYTEFCDDEAHAAGAFDRAFAKEGLARAHLAAGDATQAAACLEAGRALAGSIEDEANRAWLMKNLEELAK